MNNNLNLITKTIYSIKTPKTQQIFEGIDNKNNFYLMDKTFLKEQEKYDNFFKEEYYQWCNNFLLFNIKNYHYFYPCAGASEAIREQILYLNSLNKTLVVFEGEYEGFEAIANAVNMKVLKINREKLVDDIIKDILTIKNPVFFISNPSSIDGNFWQHFNDFLQSCDEKNISIYLDISYIGLANQIKPLNINYNCIDGIIFSLSKPFGVYYNRIGGIFLKNPNPLLYGNMWFKNIYSINFGIELLKNIKFGENMAYLQNKQIQACNILTKKFNINFYPSEVPLIANIENQKEQFDWQKNFIRTIDSEKIRICISPLLYKILWENK